MIRSIEDVIAGWKKLDTMEKSDMTQIDSPDSGKAEIEKSNHTHTVQIAEMGSDAVKAIPNVADVKTVTEEIPVNNITIRGSGAGHNYEILIDGKKLNNCKSADFHVDADGIPRVTLELYCLKGVEIDSGAPKLEKNTVEMTVKGASIDVTTEQPEEDLAAVLDSLKEIRESLNGKKE